METILASACLSLFTNIDNFAIGVAYSVNKLTIRWSANGLIASLSGISTFISMSLGSWIEPFLSPAIAHGLGSSILIVIGLRSLWSTWSQGDDGIDAPQINTQLGLREAFVLGLFLTITNLGTGVGAGLAQLDRGLTSSLSFFSSLLMIAGGSLLGNILARYSGLEILSGLGLIGLGLYEYWA